MVFSSSFLSVFHFAKGSIARERKKENGQFAGKCPKNYQKAAIV